MNVSEGEDKLQRHRCKRQQTRTPRSGSNPTHLANLLRSVGKGNTEQERLRFCCGQVPKRPFLFGVPAGS
jgi:hypothetical protein